MNEKENGQNRISEAELIETLQNLNKYREKIAQVKPEDFKPTGELFQIEGTSFQVQIFPEATRGDLLYFISHIEDLVKRKLRTVSSEEEDKLKGKTIMNHYKGNITPGNDIIPVPDFEKAKAFVPRQHLVFLTGAGVSAESGLETFRGEDGMWTDQERVRLASAGAFYYDTEKCLDFYNALRMRIAEAEPNEAHRLMAALEKDYEVTVITQNVDNLHERAGSTRVIHLHGELSKVCSSDNRTTCIKEYPLDAPIRIGDKAEDGSQLRPSVVMFGEYVISTDEAVSCIREADLFVVVGTSLKIHPAAGLIRYARPEIPKFVIDPAEIDPCVQLGFTHFKTTASEGMRRLVETLRATSLRGADNSCY